MELCILAVLQLPIALKSDTVLTVEDLVRYTTIGDPHSLNWNEFPKEAAVTSPDERRVVTLLRRGDPANSSNTAELVVFEISDLERTPQGKQIASFSSTNNAQPIAFVRWLADNETLVFAGTQGDSASQVFKLEVQTGRLTQLTRDIGELLWYDITPAGDQLVVLRKPPPVPQRDTVECRRRGCLVEQATLHALETGISQSSPELIRYDLTKGKRQLIPTPELRDDNLERCHQRDELAGGVSANGRFAVTRCLVKRMPDWWREYTVEPDLQRSVNDGFANALQQAVLVDLTQGTARKLGPAPLVPFHAGPIWIDGGRQLLVPAAVEPLINVSPDERSLRAARWSALLVNPETLETVRISRLDARTAFVRRASWDAQAQLLSIETTDADNKSLPLLRIQRRGSRWINLEGARDNLRARIPAKPRYAIDVEQSIQQRPILVAVDTRTSRRITLMDPNAWLAERKLGSIEVIQWSPKDQPSWSGALYYPPDFAPSKRYPLLIQTHGLDTKTYSLHGISRNFPGQALAAKGVLVLQVAEAYASGVVLSPQELPSVQAGYESAIDELDARGLIDRARVGIVGWSRTGPYTGYALTRSSYAFSAAALTATADFGWLWYMAGGASRRHDVIYGASPLGEGIQTWAQYAPTFNLHKVRAPMLMWGAGSGRVLWDWYAGLRGLGKPVEYWSLPDGQHEVFQVGQLIHTNQLLVDWFCFWLKDEEDPDPAKAEQYQRWRALREQQKSSGGYIPGVSPVIAPPASTVPPPSPATH